MRARLTLAAGTAALALAGSVFAASPALAAGNQPVGVTFTVAGGGLTMTVAAATATLTAGASALGGSSATGNLPATTVLDERGTLGHHLVVTMQSTAFTLDENSNGIADAGETNNIAAMNVTGKGGLISASSLGSIPLNTSAGAATNQPLSGAGSSIVDVVGLGSFNVTYTPSLSVTIPGAASSGAYVGIVTQTAS